ncbi:MAG: cell division protein ZipA C-terminal FtsZ-binding domain-containing protein [Chloroflexota bacterium]
MSIEPTSNNFPLPERNRNFVIYVRLPPERAFTVADVHPYVYGMRLGDGAKPWPHYRDAATQEWWSLARPSEKQLDALVWLINLEQLAYKSREQAIAFLKEVLPELSTVAAQFGATTEPECTIPAALEKMEHYLQRLKLENARAQIVVAAPEGQVYTVRQWWEALAGVGLELGDGDLFYRYNDLFSDDEEFQLDELFCAEPYSEAGYFHPGDLDGPVVFPDVALHFKIRDFSQPAVVLEEMAQVANQLVAQLNAQLLTVDRKPFNLSEVMHEVQDIRAKIANLDTDN